MAFLDGSEIQIEDDIDDFTLTKEGDCTTSRKFAEAYKKGEISKAEWKKAYLCWLYLNALTIGDIATCMGYLSMTIVKGDQATD